MSGDCEKCHEHTLDCKCKSFEQLISDKVTCLEFAMNGYIRIYEKGEKRCDCQSCFSLNIENTSQIQN